ncbi:hypothetical protein NDU88_005302 [Pleurodeles waltl]|uniref:Uncharacterized protein n=1 Tax=Pleurodeles waltl TaxID=8319 RepID=A0AAV7V3Y6_PLEWA|nr:hypothetical protein NDU88_005302 [Pleurodeles waltl]
MGISRWAPSQCQPRLPLHQLSMASGRAHQLLGAFPVSAPSAAAPAEHDSRPCASATGRLPSVSPVCRLSS